MPTFNSNTGQCREWHALRASSNVAARFLAAAIPCRTPKRRNRGQAKPITLIGAVLADASGILHIVTPLHHQATGYGGQRSRVSPLLGRRTLEGVNAHG